MTSRKWLKSSNTVSSNLEGIEALTSSLEKHPEVNKENVLELLISRTGKSFFQNSILKDMFIKGLIPINSIKDIAAYRINKSAFEQLNTDDEKIQYTQDTSNCEFYAIDFSILKTFENSQ